VPVKYHIALATLVLCSCFSEKSQHLIKQGLAGYIYEVSGNQMPSPGKQQSKGHPLSCDIYIYTATQKQQTKGTGPLFDIITTKLVAKTRSDSTGHYSIKLAPGIYSVFIKVRQQYFAAESNGNGILNPVTINKNNITRKNFTVNYNAAY